MILKYLNSEISRENLNAIIDHLRAIDDLMPFTVNLTPEERMRIPSMGKKSLAFVESAMGYAERHPNLVPQCVDMEASKQDLSLAIQLRTIQELLVPLEQKVKDTYMQAGAEVYASCRAFYGYVKIAAKNGVPGSTSVARDLGERYKMTRSGKNDEKKPETVPVARDGAAETAMEIVSA